MRVGTRILLGLTLFLMILGMGESARSTDLTVSANVETVIAVKPFVRQPMGLLVASSENEHYELLLAMGNIERKFSNAVDEKTINGKRYWVAHDDGGSLQIFPMIGGGQKANVRIETELDLLPVKEKDLTYNVEAREGEIFITVIPENESVDADLSEYKTANLH